MPGRLTKQTVEDVERMLRNGSTFAAIAYECDVHPQTVTRYARRLGIAPPPPALSPAVAEAVRLVEGGWSYNAAARAVQVQDMQVIKACRTRGVQSRYLRGAGVRV